MMVSAPDDILLLIFAQVVRVDDTEDEWPNIKYDSSAAEAPFTVAAVCRHWRALALATSSIWTYFGFSPDTTMKAPDLQRYELLRRRVGNAPIDVIFGWNQRYLGAERTEDIAHSIFDAILSLHLQWKTVVLHVDGCAQYGGWTLDKAFMCTQWPLLESLSLAIDSGLKLVPSAPRLRRIWLDLENNSVEDPFVAEGYPKLTKLYTYCDSVPVLRSIAPSFDSQLVELALIDDCDEFVEALGPRLTRSVFPALKCLTIDDARWLEYIDAPALQKLQLTRRYVDNVGNEALRRLDQVRELQLCSRFSTGALVILKDLPSITTLILEYPPVLRAAFERLNPSDEIDSEALWRLTSVEPTIWPHLKRLHFGTGVYNSNIDHNEQAARNIVEFVAARNARATSSDGPTVACIEAVANHPGAPEWLEERLHKLISHQRSAAV